MDSMPRQVVLEIRLKEDSRGEPLMKFNLRVNFGIENHNVLETLFIFHLKY